MRAFIASILRHWPALAFIAGQGVIPRVFTPWIGALLALIFLAGAGIAIYHAGAEWKFWPGPAICSGGQTSVSAGDITRLLQGGARKPPSCETPAWVFLGLSMAGWNALISLKLAGWSAVWAIRSSKR